MGVCVLSKTAFQSPEQVVITAGRPMMIPAGPAATVGGNNKRWSSEQEAVVHTRRSWRSGVRKNVLRAVRAACLSVGRSVAFY